MIKDKCTFREKYQLAMEMTSQAQATEYFEELVKHNMANSNHTREEAINIEKNNIGYFAGYYSNEVRARVEELISCYHPIFGAIAHRKPPTPDEALKMGMAMGEKSKTGAKIEMLRQPKGNIK